MGGVVRSVTKAVFGGGGNKAQEEALRAQREAAESAARAQAAQTNMQKNLSADLSQDNTANVQAGGLADTLDTTGDMKKRKRGQSLSTTLGIM